MYILYGQLKRVRENERFMQLQIVFIYGNAVRQIIFFCSLCVRLRCVPVMLTSLKSMWEKGIYEYMSIY